LRNQEIRIGALYPLTGRDQSIGQSIRRALEFLVDLVNNPKKGSYLKLPDLHGSKIKLIWGDTEGDPLVAQAEVRRLIKKEKVSAIIGCYNSGVTEAVSLQTEVFKIPFVNPDSDARTLTQRNLKWFFRTGPDSLIYTEKLIDLLDKTGFATATFGSLTGDNLIGLDEARTLINLSEKFRHKVNALEIYNPNLPIAKNELRYIKYVNPDILFIPQDDQDALQTIRMAKKIKYCPLAFFCQVNFLSTEELLRAGGKDAEYVVNTAVWAKSLTQKIPLARKVNDLYKRRYNENLNSDNVLSFTGLYTLIEAIAHAGSGNPQAIRKALVNINIPGYRLILPWKGIRFDKTGQNIFADSLVVQILNKTHKIVWPRNWAETSVVLPAYKCRK